MTNVLRKSMDVGGRTLTLETGRMAKQASGASSQKMKYINTVLKNWQQNGVTTLAQAEKQTGRSASAPVGRRVLAQQYEQREWHESEMAEKLGVDDLFKEEPDGQKDS